MKKIIDFFIKRPIWGNGIIAIVLMFGLYSIFTTKRSFFPELDPNTIVVSLFYPGASPKEMEEGVTIKIEQAIKGLDDIEEINSTSNENFASVRIKAYTDADMEQLLSDVENAVNSINSFPQGAEKPIVNRIKSGGMGSTVAFVGISSKKKNTNYQDLTTLATKVERDLLNTKAITQIVKSGFPEREIAVNVRENDLLRYNISMTEVSSAISQKNNDITAGLIRGGVQEMSIRSNNKVLTEEEISNIIIRTSTTGEIIHVGDVADVKLGYTESSQEARFNGKAAVSFQIEKTLDQDIAVISTELKKYQEKFNAENADFQFNIFFEFNSMLNERIDLLTSNGISGLVLVLVFLGLFLNIKLSAWVAFGIPFSFLGMFILGSMYGITINMISLFGMILVVGILVDDGIVIAENIYSHFEMGKTARKAAIEGTLEVLPSVVSSVLTTIAAFSVLLYVEGLEMMREMAFVAIACLTFSLFEAFLILPSHLAHNSVLNEKIEKKLKLWQGAILFIIGIIVIILGSKLLETEITNLGTILFPFSLIIVGAGLIFVGFSSSTLETKVRSYADKGIKYVRDNWFKSTLEMLIGTKRKWYRLAFLFPFFFTVLIGFLMKSGTIGFTFFPNIPPEFFNIEVAYSPGDSKTKTEAFIKTAQQVVLEENLRIKEETGENLLTYYTSNVGATQNLGQVGNHTGNLSVFYKAEGKKTPIDTLKNRVIRRMKATPEVQLSKEFFVGGFGRFGTDVEIGLTSSNEINIIKAKEKLRTSLEQMDGLTNVKDNMPPGRSEVYIDLLPQAEIYGLTKGDVLNQIRQAFFGQEAQRLIIGTDEVKIWVRYPPDERASLTDLENMRIKTPSGMSVLLTDISTFKLGRAPESLKRKDGERIVKVDAGALIPDSVATINTHISKHILPKLSQLYPDVQFKRLGQFERSQKTGNSMLYVTFIALAVMFIIITLHFNSLSQAFLIMLVLPAGFAGGLLGHGLVGIPVSMLSLFGLIALLGVLVNDAIVFLDRYNQLLVEENMQPREAVIEAAISRFRAILLTSLTTVAGLLPIIGETSMQAQFLIPMAVSIAFGVLFGTIFILFFFASAILVWNGRARRFKRLWTGKRLDPLEVEPAIKLHKSIHQQEHE